jgi:hypothetical protein
MSAPFAAAMCRRRYFGVRPGRGSNRTVLAPRGRDVGPSDAMVMASRQGAGPARYGLHRRPTPAVGSGRDPTTARAWLRAAPRGPAAGRNASPSRRAQSAKRSPGEPGQTRRPRRVATRQTRMAPLYCLGSSGGWARAGGRISSTTTPAMVMGSPARPGSCVEARPRAQGSASGPRTAAQPKALRLAF